MRAHILCALLVAVSRAIQFTRVQRFDEAQIRANYLEIASLVRSFGGRGAGARDGAPGDTVGARVPPSTQGASAWRLGATRPSKGTWFLATLRASLSTPSSSNWLKLSHRPMFCTRESPRVSQGPETVVQDMLK